MRFKDFLDDRKIYDNGYEQSTPDVSIVMPTYCRNAEGLLKGCIESVLNQTYKNFEFIIVDDGSKDGTQDVVMRYADMDSRIVYARHDINCGLPAVRTNEGIILARGPYVAFMFDDNVWDERFLETLMSEMQKNPADVQYSVTKMVVSETESFYLGKWPLTLEFLYNINTIPNGSVLCRRDFFDKIGLYDSHILLRRICDWDLWLRAKKCGATFNYVDIPLSTELGPSSPVSLGLSVKWDYKTTYAYMVDETRLKSRIEQLKPDAIMDLDVFDPIAVLPYIRDISEWNNIEKVVYEPFFETHPYYSYNKLIVNNRLYDEGLEYRIAPSPINNVWKKKLRVLLVCNVYHSIIDEWKRALQKNQENIVLTCGEWQLSAFTPQDIDMIIMFDCTARFMYSHLREFKDYGVPISYISCYGMLPSDNTIPECVDYEKMDCILEVFKIDLYFPRLGIPWRDIYFLGAQELINISDAVYVFDKDAKFPFEVFPRVVPIETSPNSSDDNSLYINSLFKAMLLNKKLQRNIGSQKCCVLLNSELLAGSEVYGLLLAKILTKMGIETQVCVPKVNVYGSDGDKTSVNKWLSDRGLADVIEAPYAPGGNANALFEEQVMLRTKEFSEWVDTNNIGMIICSCFIMEVAAVMSSKQIPVFFALFQPIGHDFDSMTFLREVSSGFMSDCSWSANMWSRWFAPPVSVIPSAVESEMFTIANKALEEEPICIAIGGTLQPRKRQLEAIQACYNLIKKGYNIQVNIYGYSLQMLSEYVNLIKDYIKYNRLEEHIVLHGLVDFKTIIENNHIILSAAVDESLPQTLIYAMASGLIGVGCPAGGIDEVIKNNVTGYLAKGFSVPDIESVLQEAIDARCHWKQIVTTAQNMLKNNYSEAIVSQKLFDTLLEGTTVTFSSGRQVARKMNQYLQMNGWNDTDVESDTKTNINTIARVSLGVNELIPSYPISNKRSYSFYCYKDQVKRIGIYFGTHQQQCQGTISFKILNPNHIVLREGTVDLSIIKDNEMHVLNFSPISNCKDKTLILQLNFKYDKKIKYISVYENDTMKYTNKMVLKILRKLGKTGSAYVEL